MICGLMSISKKCSHTHTHTTHTQTHYAHNTRNPFLPEEAHKTIFLLENFISSVQKMIVLLLQTGMQWEIKFLIEPFWSQNCATAVFRPLFLLVACTLCDFLFIYHCRPLWGEVGVEYNIWVSSPAGTQIHGVNSRSWFSSFYRIKLLFFASQQRWSITLGQYLAPQSLHFFFFTSFSILY